tara:strand:- start:416 stop:625 length:210 start_codon:yes stop_codon:yes gene_type:complete
MSRIFRIVEARCVDTNTLEKRKVYTTDQQYKKRGQNSIKELRLLYNVTVVTFNACEENTVKHLKRKKDE